jgi:hypothetical protein
MSVKIESLMIESEMTLPHVRRTRMNSPLVFHVAAQQHDRAI